MEEEEKKAEGGEKAGDASDELRGTSVEDEKKDSHSTSSSKGEKGELDFQNHHQKVKRRNKPFMPGIIEETEEDLEEEMREPEQRPEDDEWDQPRARAESGEPEMAIGDLTSLIKFEKEGRRELESHHENQEQPLELSTLDMEDLLKVFAQRRAA